MIVVEVISVLPLLPLPITNQYSYDIFILFFFCNQQFIHSFIHEIKVYIYCNSNSNSNSNLIKLIKVLRERNRQVGRQVGRLLTNVLNKTSTRVFNLLFSIVNTTITIQQSAPNLNYCYPFFYCLNILPTNSTPMHILFV